MYYNMSWLSLSCGSIGCCTGRNVLPGMKNNLRVLRATENMTQAELARQSGVSRQTINSIEAGRYISSTVLALKIAKIFGVPVEQVFMLEQGD